MSERTPSTSITIVPTCDTVEHAYPTSCVSNRNVYRLPSSNSHVKRVGCVGNRRMPKPAIRQSDPNRHGPWLPAMITAGAALVTMASIWLVPGGPIWFGILHALAATALICLIFLRLPWPLTLAVAVLIFAAARGPRFPAFDPLWLVWTGLAETRPMMGDYVPLVPWAAPALAGLAIAKALKLHQWRGTPPSRLTRTLTFPGRHSLIIYLFHQPILFGLFNAYHWANS